VVFREALSKLARSRIAKTTGPQRDVVAIRQFLDAPIVDQMALRFVTIEGDRPASHRRRSRPVDTDHVASVSVSQIEQRAEEPFGETRYARVNGLDADALEMREADCDGGDAQEIQGAILKSRFARRQDTDPSLNGCEIHRATGKPGPVQA